MQKYAGLYVKYAEVYLLHILHLYALPTLLMESGQGTGTWRRKNYPRLCTNFTPTCFYALEHC